MKTLSIRQPWATAICCGLKDVENRTWSTDYRGRVLIHTGVSKFSEKKLQMLPPHLFAEICTAQMCGLMPELEDLPYGAIIGYATLVECTEEVTGSMWEDDACVRWVFEDAYLFDEPIMNVKGQLNLYETPEITEENLPPAHKANQRYAWMQGQELSLNVVPSLMARIKDEKPTFFDIFLTDTIFEALDTPEVITKDGKINVKKIRFINGDDELAFKVKEVGIEQQVYEDTEEPISLTLPDGTEFDLNLIVFELEQ